MKLAQGAAGVRPRAGGSRFHGQVNNLYGWSLITRRRFDEARAQLQLAEDLDPASPGSRTNMVTDLIFERKSAWAKQEMGGIFRLNPKSLQGEHDLEWIAAIQSDCETGGPAAGL